MTLSLDHQAVVARGRSAARPCPARPVGPVKPEAQLVDGQAQILDLVVAEAQPAGQAGRGDPGQTKELRQGRDDQSDFVARGHDLRTVAACPAPRPGSDRDRRPGRTGSGWRPRTVREQ